MDTVFFLQQEQRLRVGVHDVCGAPRARHILITTARARRALQESQLAGFDAIRELEDFAEGPISAVIQEELGEAQTGPRVVTNDEYCLRLATQLRHRFGPKAEQAVDVAAFIDKVRMKERASSCGVPTPRCTRFSPKAYAFEPSAHLRELEAPGYPLIGKPVDQSNNRNVSRIDTRSQLESWAVQHQLDENYEVEEFVTGTLFHCNAIVRGGRVEVVQVGEYMAPLLELSRGRPAGSITLPKSSATYRAIAALATQALYALGTGWDYVSHVEVFVRPNGLPVFLEAAARAPGALVGHASEIHAGVQLEEANFRLQLGCYRPQPSSSDPRYAAWLWYPQLSSSRLPAQPLPELECDHRFYWEENRHQPDSLIRWDPAIACGGLMWSSSYDVLRRDFERLREYVPYRSDVEDR